MSERARILLIDLENCPNQIKQLQENLEHFSQVIICYAKTGVKIPLDWLVPLSSIVNKNKLKIYKMERVGKNSADFGICFFAGALMQEFDNNADFIIISNDIDLDYVVSLLRDHGCQANRMGAIENKPSDKIINLTPIQTYCQHLSDHTNNRPASDKTLKTSIGNKFQDKPTIAAKVFELLKSKNIITILDNKVTYHNNKIEETLINKI